MINRNGGEYLQRALRSIAKSFDEAWRVRSDFEFILVDNNSSDDSIQIAHNELTGKPWEWKVAHESEAGVNAARLAGLHTSGGRYVVFTDNDLEFETSWVLAYFEAFATYSQMRVFAGRVLVGTVDGALPDWLDLDGEYSRPSIVVRCDNGVQPMKSEFGIPNVEGPVGPNMAFERSIFADYGEFNRNFGLRPGSLVAGAEAEFFHRLAVGGEPFAYVPNASVRHPLKRSQISKGYFRNRLAGVGRVLARIMRNDGIQAKRVFGIKRYLFRELLIAWLRYGATWFQTSTQKRFYYRCNISIVWGQIVEDFASRRSRELKCSTSD